MEIYRWNQRLWGLFKTAPKIYCKILLVDVTCFHIWKQVEKKPQSRWFHRYILIKKYARPQFLTLVKQDSKQDSVRCADKLFANPELSTSLPWLYKFTALYKNSRLLWMMTFFFLLPVIFTALGAVVIALKSAQYKYHGPAGRIKARDERRMNALVIAIYVGFILCWIPHYCYEVQSCQPGYASSQ